MKFKISRPRTSGINVIEYTSFYLLKYKKITLFYFIITSIFTIYIKNYKTTHDKSSFEIAVSHLFKEEGGIENDKEDKGGVTNYGISLNFLKQLICQNPSLITDWDFHHNGVIDSYDISHMNKNNAKWIYKTQWWDKYNYGEITYQALSNKVLEISVNMGPKRAAFFLIKAYHILYGGSPIIETSKLNNMILSKINSLSEGDNEKIIKKLEELCVQHYFNIVKKDPSQQKFLRGWIRRIYSTNEQ